MILTHVDQIILLIVAGVLVALLMAMQEGDE